MRLHRLRLTHYRGIQRCELHFPDRGVTVVEGPNEVGKTSLAEAVDLLLRYPDSSADRLVKAAQPVHVDAGPEVEAELTLGAERLVYRKRWQRHPETQLRVLTPEPRSLTGREAHDHVRLLLDASVDDGLWRALRLAQGTALAQAALGSSPPLLRALEQASAGALGGPEEMGLLERAQQERDRYLTRAQGRPTQEVQTLATRLREAERQEQEALAAILAVAQDLERHEEVARELAGLQAGRAAQESLVTQLEAQVAEAEQLRRRRAELESRRLAQDSQLRLAVVSCDGRREHVERAGRLAGEVVAGQGRLADVTQQSGVLRERMAVLEARQAQTQAEVDTARADARVAEADRDLWTGAAELARLEGHEREVTAVDAQLTAALDTRERTAIARRVVEQLETLRDELIRAQGRAQLEGARLRIEALGPIAIEVAGQRRQMALGEALDLAVDASTTVELPGLLRLTATTGRDAAQRSRDVEAKRRALDDACGDAGVADPAEGRRRLQAHEHATEQAEQARSRLHLLLGDGTVELLRRQLADQAAALQRNRADRPGEGRPLPEDLAAAERSLQAARAASERIGRAAAERDAELSTVRQLHANREGERVQLASQLQVLEAAAAAAETALRSERRALPDEELESSATTHADRLQSLSTELVQVTGALEAVQGAGVDERFANARTVLRRDRERAAELERERVELQTRVRVRGSEGPQDRLERARTEREASRQAHDGVQLRSAAAQLLHATLLRHREAARQRYQEPFRRELESLARIVFGGEVTLGLDDDLRVTQRSLGAATVPYESLSGGAREQLALCALLACAALVAPEDGVPILIDDALGYSDPLRLERLGAVLAQAGRHSQIIVLTCMPERYRNVGGATRLRLHFALASDPPGDDPPPSQASVQSRRRQDPSPAAASTPEVDHAILRVLAEAGAPLGRTDIVMRARVPDSSWHSAVSRLLNAGLVTRTGQKRGTRYQRANTAADGDDN
ncbi:MAG TPA: AAA family ATPase [Verrucomicrobiae bacterium]|nr:AAA family ATPase [Verrucomicrobiae bacterium]